MTAIEDRERISTAASLLYDGARTIRVLTHIAWPDIHRVEFLQQDCQQLPRIEYPPFDTAPTLACLAQARQLIHDDSEIDLWLDNTANSIETSARMLAACGTAEFLQHSRVLYGSPDDVLRDEKSTSLDLANRFNEVFESISHTDLGAPAPACYLAEHVAGEMRSASHEMFGAQAPSVEVVDELSANALAGPKQIRIRRGASFSKKDIAQLIQHEAYIHVATSLNGLEQEKLKILGASHPGSTKTQEGLAVFAEFISGAMDIDRFRRLADRIVAIKMAIDGANFIDVFRYFEERVNGPEQAFENARRVFRGGVVSGGIPFTKDIVYLDGLLRVHDFLRAIVTAGRSDCLQLLFCGKLDIEDIPVLCQLADMGLCRPPRYLPPWAADRRFLLSYLTYSSYLDSIDFDAIRSHYTSLLQHSPKVDLGRQ